MSIQRVAPKRNETGRYTTSYSDEDFLEALRELGGAAGTSDVAEEVGCVRDSAYRRLNGLADKGVVERREVGNSLSWVLSD